MGTENHQKQLVASSATFNNKNIYKNENHNCVRLGFYADLFRRVSNDGSDEAT